MLAELELERARAEKRCFADALAADEDVRVRRRDELQPNNDAAYLIGGVVLPELRGRGVYRALVRARLEAVRGRLSLATTHAREATSAPILERLGFRTAFRYSVLTAP
jgi:GNAT superfamily N-acetyltransferase